MPSTPTASVSYKKQDGTLVLSADRKYLFFTPATPPGSSPAVTIPVNDITNLQQTPESSPKVALKVLVRDDNYVFSFTGKINARKEQENVTDALRNVIAANQAGKITVASTKIATNGQQNGASTEQSASMAIAKAISSKAVDEGWYDDAKLKADTQLQSSLLKANPQLQARLNQALKDRPEGVSIPQFNSQFWSARLHLLRAHAIEKAQRQGEYNVLPEIRFTRKAAEKDGDPDIKMLNITKEQIQLIFRQYPVVKEAYDANVPAPMDPGQFWTRFFGSRLLKRLKGEKITQQDPLDSVLDIYLDRNERAPLSLSDQHIPRFIDLEGNEQNHSQRLGNRPDEDMRPSSYDKVPILRTLNNLSQKMLSHVAPEDGEAHGPIGLDEEAYEQLRLNDLAMGDEDRRVRLSVREQQRYGGGEDDDLSHDAKLYARQDPAKVLSSLGTDLLPERLGSDEHGPLRLDRVLGFNSDDDSDSEDESVGNTNGNANIQSRKQAVVGSHAAMNGASTSVLASIKQRRIATSSDPSSLKGLSESTFEQLKITHSTTTEYLHYFWTLFLSEDSSRTPELAQMVASLDRSLDRINAVAKTAEDERQRKIDTLKRQMEEYERRTGKRRKLDLSAVDGGKAVVDAMVRPMVEALGTAARVYRKALEEQTREAGAAVGGD